MSEFRRKLLFNLIESDVDYVKRLALALQFIYPASIYYDSTRLRIRGYNGSGDNWPEKRFQVVLPRSIAKVPITWWGTNGGYYIYPDEANLTYIHIPASIKKFKFKHNAPSSYNISMDVFTGLTNPTVYTNSGWRSPGSWYTFNFSDGNDKWIAFTGRYTSSNSIIPFTTPELFKQIFNFEIDAE